ncbi:MAG: hypothetical protein ACOX2O_01945 [Bdellovibrionota bacterium]|jgi:hypothetical protein
MAFISTKNLLAPLTNKFHLVIIILVAVLFSVFRLSGGKVEVSSNTNVIPKQNEGVTHRVAVQQQAQQERNLQPAGDIDTSKPFKLLPFGESDGAKKREVQPKQARPQEGSTDPSSLEDILNSL